MADFAPGCNMLQRIEREAAALRPSRLTPDLVPLGNGPDASKLWIPEDLTPLSGTEVYNDLTEEQRLRYNQYVALKLSEDFIWIETCVIIPAIKKLLKGEVPSPAFRTLLKSFVVDEENHSSAVWLLLRSARPDLYSNNEFLFVRPPSSVVWMVAMAGQLPRLLSGWALFTGMFEEKTITISRMYRDATEDVDPLFKTVFTLHALDEARHCKLDSFIAEWLIAPQRKLSRWINGKYLEMLNVAYLDMGWGCDRPIRLLVTDFSELGERETRMIEETKRALAGQFSQYTWDRSSTPITARNAERYDMLDRAIRRVAKANIH